ncbi:MAG: hypothetical protein JXB10_19440 [Pirellulales bacterium]|nr:hypothetical protein [Pirellulales bacterium]
MDPLRLCLVVGPIAVYLLMLGALNLSRRPFLVSGGRDMAALALAVTGLMIVGPFSLFLSGRSIDYFGSWIWVMILALYALLATMGILLARPRLVIYNISADRLRPILAEVVSHLDAEARWAGDSIALSNLGVQLTIDNFSPLKNISLKAVGNGQDYPGWRRLEHALADALTEETGRPNPRGLTLLFTGLLLLTGLGLMIYHNPQEFTQSLTDFTTAVLQMLHLQ